MTFHFKIFNIFSFIISFILKKMFLIVLFQLATFLYTEKQENELKFNKTFPESEWVKLLSCVRLFAIPWTIAYQGPPSMEFFRQEYWSGLPFPSPGDLLHPGIEPRFSTLKVDALPFSYLGSPESLIFQKVLLIKQILF